jgi:hypothetical protein
MQFKAAESGIEVLGQTVYAVVDGFGAFSMIGSKYLADVGLGSLGPDGVIQLVNEGWYAQERWLTAFERISREIGDSALHLIGKRIPLNAVFPPWVTDVDSAIRSVDVAYHLNHRKQGQVMFDLEKGTMLEGIGHYGYAREDGAKPRIVSRCDNPYPCAFDQGILTSMTQRFARSGRVEHAPGDCRKQGAETCTYVVTW